MYIEDSICTEEEVPQERIDLVAKAFKFAENNKVDGWEQMNLDTTCDTLFLISKDINKYTETAVNERWRDFTPPVNFSLESIKVRFWSQVETNHPLPDKTVVIVEFDEYSLVYWEIVKVSYQLRVANSYNDNISPVDGYTVNLIIKEHSKGARAYYFPGQPKKYANYENVKGYWSPRSETIFKLLLAGF